MTDQINAKKLKPILYPFHGEIYDERTFLRISLANFRVALSEDRPFKKSRGDDIVFNYNGIYKYMFCTISDLISSFHASYRWNPLYDNLQDVREPSKKAQDDIPLSKLTTELVFNQKTNIVNVPFHPHCTKIEYRMKVIEQFLKETCLNWLPPNSSLDNKRVNIFTFFSLISKMMSGQVQAYTNATMDFLMDGWDDNEIKDYYLSGHLSVNETFKIQQMAYFTTHHPEKQFKYHVSSKNGLDDYKHCYSYSIDWYPLMVIEYEDLLEKYYHNQYACIHATFSLNTFHVHVFKNRDDFIRYYLNCLYRTYKAQMLFQQTRDVLSFDRRGCYGVVTNRFSLNGLTDVFGFNPQCLFGVPVWAVDLNDLPVRATEFIKLLRTYYQNYIQKCFPLSGQFTGICFYKSMHDLFLSSQKRRPTLSVLPKDLIVFDDPKVSYHNIADIDPPTTKTIDIIEYSNSIPLNADITKHLNVCRPPDATLIISSKYRNFHYDACIEIPNGIMCQISHTDDEVLLNNYRRCANIRDILKNSFKQSIQPKTIRDTYLGQHYLQNLPSIDNLFYSCYVYSDPINYTIQNGIISIVSGATVSDNFNKVNTSTFKLYALIWKYYIVPNINVLSNTIKVVFFGAIEEVNVKIFKNLTQGRWDVSGIGSDAVTPNLRSNVFSMLVLDKCDVLVSDIDVSECETVADVIDKTKNLIEKILNMTKILAICKIQYPLVQVLLSIKAMMKYKYRLVKSVGTRPGSGEIFLIMWPNVPIDRDYSDVSLTYFVTVNFLFTSKGKNIDYAEPNDYLQCLGNNCDYLDSKVMSYYCSDDNIQNALSLASTFCAVTSTGKMTPDYTNRNDGLVRGLTNIERIALYCRKPGFFMYRNHLNSQVVLNGRINSSQIKLKSISPSTSFTNSQRLSAAKVYDEIQEDYDVFKGQAVYDVGCRNYHGIIFGRYYDHPYVGIDVNEMILVPNRNITFKKEKVDIAGVQKLLATPTTVLIYNSLFMTYDNPTILFNDIKKMLDKMILNSCVVFSLYICDSTIADNLNRSKMGKAIVKPIAGENRYFCSLGAYDPVASLTPAEVNSIIQLKTPNLSLHCVVVTHSDQYTHSLSYGRSPNLETHYLLPLLNVVQGTFVAFKHASIANRVVRSVPVL